MTTPPRTTPPGAGSDDPGLTAVTSERRQLLGVAYRLLGSWADAEDVVQETYARWYAMTAEQRDEIESPGAWLTKVASRICLDVLRSARVRRETYVGEWVPEPVPGGDEWVDGRRGGTSADPADRVTLDESISMAFLVVLESMTPAERVAFVLHDVFRFSFREIAEVVGRTPAACRQLASSARRRIDGSAPRAARAPTEDAELVRSFKEAWEARDIGALVTILDPDVVAVADGGGVVKALLEPLHGADVVARSIVGLWASAPNAAVLERTVNGGPGLVVQVDGATATVLAFGAVDGRITHIWAVRNPDKLRRWTT